MAAVVESLFLIFLEITQIADTSPLTPVRPKSARSRSHLGMIKFTNSKHSCHYKLLEDQRLFEKFDLNNL